MNTSWWMSVVQWTLWGLLMTLAMGWVARSRLRARLPAAQGRLQHPPSILVVGLGGFAFFFGLAVLSNVYANETTTWATTSVFLGFALLSGLLVADYFLARHMLVEGGLDYGRLTGRRRRLAWTDVTRVRYAPALKWFKIQTAEGRVARVSASMTGLPAFAEAVLRDVPPAAIDADTHAVLRAAAAGDLPPVW
jgi:hypothetical protein